MGDFESEAALPASEANLHLLLDSPDVLDIVLNLLDAKDKHSLRQTCRNAREAVDSTVEALHLVFTPEEGEDSIPRTLLNCTPDEDELARCQEMLRQSIAYKNLPGLGHAWGGALSVTIENCPFSALTEQILYANTPASLRWPRLQQLKLINCCFGRWNHEAVLQALISQSWPCLEVLELCGCTLDSADLNLLAQLEAPSLKELDLSDNKLVTLAGLSSANFPHLDTLAVCCNLELNLRASLPTLTSAATFQHLEDLDLSGVPLTGEDVAALALAPWQRLSWLTLAGCQLMDCTHASPDAGFYKVLAKQGVQAHELCGFYHLQHLDLRSNIFSTGEFLGFLGSISASLRNLRSIDISSNNNLRPNALSMLRQSYWPVLQHFEASNLVLVAAGVDGLTAADMPSLRKLTLRNCIMSWNAVDRLSNGNWRELRKLDLGGANGVHLRRAISLVPAHWPKLKYLILRQVSSSRVKTTNRQALLRLVDKWPGLHVRCEG